MTATAKDPRPTKPATTSTLGPSGAPNSRPARSAPVAKNASLDGSTFPAAIDETAPVGGTPQGSKSRRRTSEAPLPSGRVSDGPSPQPTKGPSVTTARPSAAPTSPAAREDPLTPTLATPQGTQTTGRHTVVDTHDDDAAGSDGTPDREAALLATPTGHSLLDLALSLSAESLDDLERTRIASENRLRQMTRNEPDKDGEERGWGLPLTHPDVLVQIALVRALFCKAKVLEELGFKRPPKERGKPCCLECTAVRNLELKMQAHPLGAWVKAQKGVGDKQAARLLAALGDPYLNLDKGVPRTVSALWRYCGLHVLPVDHLESDAHRPAVDRNQPPGSQSPADPQRAIAARTQLPASQPRLDALGRHAGGAQLPGGLNTCDDHKMPAAGDQHRDTDLSGPGNHVTGVGVAAKRRKGEQARWSTKGKTKAILVAKSCIKQWSPQCRLVGHITPGTQREAIAPACTCSPYRVIYDQRKARTTVTHPEWTPKHRDNDALRVTAKEILKHLWRAARDWHQAQEAS